MSESHCAREKIVAGGTTGVGIFGDCTEVSVQGEMVGWMMNAGTVGKGALES